MVIDLDRLGKRGDIANGLRKQPLFHPFLELVFFGAIAGITEITIQLVGIQTKSYTCLSLVAGPAVGPTGVIPALNTGRVIKVGDRDVVRGRIREQLGIRSFFVPTVGDPVEIIGGDYHEAGFEAANGSRFAFNGIEFEVFHGNSTLREGPEIIW